MAFMITKSCARCFKEFNGVESPGVENDYCGVCADIVEREKRDIFLKTWRENLTLEERIAKIEVWIYYQQKHQHISPFTVF